MPAREFASPELRLAAIVQSSDDAIISKDLDGTIRSWNPAAERIFGYTAAEAIGRSIQIIVPPDRRGEEEEVLARLRRGEAIDHFETVRVRKDGTLVPILLTVSPLRTADGVIVGASKIARDLSERVGARAELAAARAQHADLEQRLMALVSASGWLLGSLGVDDVVSATITLAGQLVQADGYAMWRLHGGRAWRIEASNGISSEFAGRLIPSYRNASVSVVPSTSPLIANDVDQTPMLEEQREAYHREGIRSILAVPLLISGEAAGTVVFYHRRPHAFSEVEVETARALGNLVSAALTTAELYAAQRRSRAQSEFLVDVGTLLAMSLDYEETLKRVAELAVPHIADWCVVHLVDETGRIERLVVAHKDPAKVEMAQRFRERYREDPAQHVIRTGEPVMLEVTDELLASAARSPEHLDALRGLGLTSFMCVPMSIRDRTIGAITLVAAESRRRYTEEDLQFGLNMAARAALAVENARIYEEARRANRVKDEFLATLSHELRTPLNAILGYARMLKAGLIDRGRQARVFDMVDKNASALTQIVDDLLDVSRIVAGKLRLRVQPVDLAPLVAQAVETVRPAADAKGVRLQPITDVAVPPVAGDPDRLRQVVWNLLSNAVKFTPHHGQVQVRLECASSHVTIVVSDTGVGIASEFLPHLFERFRQADSSFAREYGGLGLGLAIVRHLVEMHGGTVGAVSDGVGKGATFRVALPIMLFRQEAADRPVTQSEPRVDAEPAPTRLDGVHVLAVDDEEDALALLSEILESSGAQVTTARSAAEALGILAAIRPHLILSDVGMPGVDGFEFIARVRQLSPAGAAAIPAVALTAYARSEDRTRALRAGFQMHLAKPIDPEELVAAIRALASRELLP